MKQFHLAMAIAFLAAATATYPPTPARAAPADGSLAPSQNPLIGTWLLSAEVVNPNLPTRCAADRIVFAPDAQTAIYKSVTTQAAARYMSMGPKIAVWGNAGYKLYTIIDHDHIMLDEIPRCTWQRGPLTGQTALLQALATERGETAAPTPAQPPPPSPLADNPQVRAAMEKLERSSAEIDRFLKEQTPPK